MGMLSTSAAIRRAGGAAATAATLTLLTACGAGTGPGEPAGAVSPPPATQPANLTGAATPVASETTAAPAAATPSRATRALPVYYVGDTAAGPVLYREFHAVPTADPASDAVRELLATPAGIDPDYRSHWPAGTRLLRPVTHTGGVITVDLSGEARTATVGAQLAELTVQQLVYTVQGALQSSDPVQILVDGAAVPELWGHVATGQPVRRADPYATRSHVQIDNPAHGARTGRTVTVSGEAASFEATLGWEVLRDGAVVSSGFATAAEGQRFSAFSFTLTLDPGEYLLRVTEDDPSGGAGRPPSQDTKVISVG